MNRPARESARGWYERQCLARARERGGGAGGLRPVRLTVPRKGRRLTDDVQTLRRGHPGVAASRERGSHWRTLRWVMRKMSSHVTRAFCSGSRRRRVAASRAAVHVEAVSSAAPFVSPEASGHQHPPLQGDSSCLDSSRRESGSFASASNARALVHTMLATFSASLSSCAHGGMSS